MGNTCACGGAVNANCHTYALMSVKEEESTRDTAAASFPSSMVVTRRKARSLSSASDLEGYTPDSKPSWTKCRKGASCAKMTMQGISQSRLTVRRNGVCLGDLMPALTTSSSSPSIRHVHPRFRVKTKHPRWHSESHGKGATCIAPLH
eukprot:TRINITY_DN53404_c0_g1_i1.p1 TRINITY_DN53404_c0_g1~~TRINITY_DN53404_c0_g1_i1.p1  ORF type:complete len:148 (-),score=28.12 TRINITY_DN53404_c0_g1_i1:159-602(-)